MTTGILETIVSDKEFHCQKKPFLPLTKDQHAAISTFNNAVKNGTIQFEFVPCLCGEKSFGLIASVDRYSFLQSTVICKRCGLIQSNPRMTSDEYARFYSSDMYRKCYESENFLSTCKSKYALKTGAHIFEEINNAQPVDKTTSVLEFGAGGGWNLLPFIQKGAKVLGMDHSPSLVCLGRENGISMKQGDVSKIEGLFDVIILNHVYEHFLDPIEALKKIAAHLKENGILYIAVPNILHFGIGQIQNAHTYYFTPDTFKHYVSKSGLKHVQSGSAEVTHMYGIFKKERCAAAPFNDRSHWRKMYLYLKTFEFKRRAKKIIKGAIKAIFLKKEKAVD